MGTNLRSSGFPARDLCCRGCADRGLCRLSGSREAAKPRRETHKFSVRFSVGGIQFSVFGQASRGRESAGAGPGCLSNASEEGQGEDGSLLMPCVRGSRVDLALNSAITVFKRQFAAGRERLLPSR